jgi:hypothetical protein
MTNIFGTCNNFTVLSVILVNTKLCTKNLDSFLTNILQVQSQAILQEKRVIALIFNGLAISPQARIKKIITLASKWSEVKRSIFLQKE